MYGNIWKDEDQIIDTAKEQYRVLKTENEFRYGYKVVVVTQTLIAEASVFWVSFVLANVIYLSLTWTGEWEHKVCSGDKQCDWSMLP